MWRSSRNGRRVDVSGPVGDTLKLHLRSNDTAFDWTGWTWRGQVRQSAGSSVVSSFSFSDNSTSTGLNLVATIADTSAWTARDAMVYAIEGTKSGETYTFIEGQVVPTDNIATA
jgi:hypothetical protein